ncbi:hypothetical protein [Thermaurantiacus tibetensis]|uniref:hypothetical protein n=1 Tax=Thermaurantiacus tibetensis TaxID=2759035 RepID=UPI00188E2332|nr:hypothetical protein [Thermaurantiacus tibetensis]
MTEEAPKPRVRRKPAAAAAPDAPAKPKTPRKPRAPKADAKAPTDGATAGAASPAPLAERVEQLAEEAVEKGRKLLETETGQKVAEVADKAFETAEQALERAQAAGRRALESEKGREVTGTARAVLKTPLGRNVAIGAGVGAAAGLLILNPLLGALIGGGLGYLRTLTRKG